MEKFLCSLYRIRYNNCRVHFLLFVLFSFIFATFLLVSKSCCSQMHCMNFFPHSFYFQRVLLQIKMWARPFSLWHRLKRRKSRRIGWESAGKKMKATKWCTVLSNAVILVYECIEHNKMELENRLLLRKTRFLIHTYTNSKLWKIEYSE